MFSILLSSASEFLQNAAPGEHDLSDMATIKIINVCSVSSLRISVTALLTSDGPGEKGETHNIVQKPPDRIYVQQL